MLARLFPENRRGMPSSEGAGCTRGWELAGKNRADGSGGLWGSYLRAPWARRGCWKRKVCLPWTTQGTGIGEPQEEGCAGGSAGVSDSELWGDRPWVTHGPRGRGSRPRPGISQPGSVRTHPRGQRGEALGERNATSLETVFDLDSFCWATGDGLYAQVISPQVLVLKDSLLAVW